MPSTPTSASGAFWKGTELGTEAAAVPPAAQSTTSEVVKSKSGASPMACGVGGPGSTPEVQQFPPTPPTQHPARALGGKEGGGQGGEAPPDPLLPARPCSPGALVGDQADRLLAVLPRGAHGLPHRHAAPPLPRQLLGVGRRGGLHPAAGGPRARARARGRGWMGWGLHPHQVLPFTCIARPPALQVIEKERPQLAECEEPSIYSPAFPREKWQRKRTQVKIRVRARQASLETLPLGWPRSCQQRRPRPFSRPRPS